MLSFGALAVPVLATFRFPEAATDYELLLWLLALIPAFLLAYYRGWNGVAVALLVGMAILALVQVAVLMLAIPTNWVGKPFMSRRTMFGGDLWEHFEPACHGDEVTGPLQRLEALAIL